MIANGAWTGVLALLAWFAGSLAGVALIIIVAEWSKRRRERKAAVAPVILLRPKPAPLRLVRGGRA